MMKDFLPSKWMCLLALFSFCAINLYASENKGSLLIIGGGSENITSTTSWNYEAFCWAVNQSANKKVAIIHYATTTSSAFENYFKTYCGASEVKSFVVNSIGANDASLMDEISGYDMFYFRGGDQWEYYNQWKGQLMEEVIHSKFNSGGVICGTSAGLAILSGTTFVAEHGECYSNGAVKNTNLITITLRDDFLRMMPGFVFDSHYTNRGRLGRLAAFMAHWKKNKNESLVGIGVDEITALAINPDGRATAYGAGIVSIVRERSGIDYSPSTALAVDSLEITQLSHGRSINLNTFVVDAFGSAVEPSSTIETTPSKIYISGGDRLNTTNESLLEQFAAEVNRQEEIIVLTGQDQSLALEYKAKLNGFGASNVHVYEATGETSTSSELASLIRSAQKFLFVGNNTNNLITLFYNSGGVAANALKEAFVSRALYLAFIGDNARFCGQVVVDNYINASANATISNGFGLIKTATIIPKTFERPQSGAVTTYWHGTNAAIPYAMVSQGVKNGIWLNDDNYILFKGKDNKAMFTVYGASPVFVQTLHGTRGEIVSQTYSGTGNPDTKAAFDFMYLSFLNEGQEYMLADFESAATGIDEELEMPSIRMFPNPTSDQLNISSNVKLIGVRVYNMIGVRVYSSVLNEKELSIDISSLNFPKGIYLVEAYALNNMVVTKRIVVN